MKGVLSRYGTLVFYTIVAYLVCLFCSKTKFWDWWLQFWQTSLFTEQGYLSPLNYKLQIFYIAAGLTINRLANNFLVYSSYRCVTPNLKYPPVTFSVSFIVIFQFFIIQPISLDFLFILWGLIGGLSFYPLWDSTVQYLFRADNLEKYTNIASNSESVNLTDEQLQQAKFILTKLQSDVSHIAICGKYGVGKSTVINDAIKCILPEDGKGTKSSVMNDSIGEFKSNKNNQTDSENCKVLHCNVDLWGVKTEAIVEYVLNMVVLKLNNLLSMTAFRNLPEHYQSAIKQGNSYFKIFSAFLNKYQVPEKVFIELNDILKSNKIKLIISIQDLDRNPNAISGLNELAGLLDRLKSQSHIKYIFAAEITPEFSKTILRICPTRIDIESPVLEDLIEKFITKLTKDLKPDFYKLICPKRAVNIKLLDDILPSFRAWEELKIQVEHMWWQGKFKGEIYLYDLMLFYALKANNPKIADSVSDLIEGNVFRTGRQNSISFGQIITEFNFISGHPETKIFEEVLTQLQFIDEKSKSRFIFDVDEEGVPASYENNLHISLDSQKKDVLSLMHPENLKFVKQGSKPKSSFSHFKAYDVFLKISDENFDSVDEFIEGVKESYRGEWVKAFEQYGQNILFQKSRKVSIPQILICRFLKCMNHDLSDILLLKLRVSGEIKADCVWVEYLNSKVFIVDMVNLYKHFGPETLFNLSYLLNNYHEYLDLTATCKLSAQINNLFQGLLSVKDPLVEVNFIFALGSNDNVSKKVWSNLNPDILDKIQNRVNQLDKFKFDKLLNDFYPDYIREDDYFTPKLKNLNLVVDSLKSKELN